MSGPFSTTPFSVALVARAPTAADIEQQTREFEALEAYKESVRAYLETVMRRFVGRPYTAALRDEIAWTLADSVALPRPVISVVSSDQKSGAIEFSIDFARDSR